MKTQENPKELQWNDILTVEDSLQQAHVFLNGFSNRPCHSDSYMTVVDFAALDAWLKTEPFTLEVLQYCVEYWQTNENMQPPLKIVSASVARHFKLKQFGKWAN